MKASFIRFKWLAILVLTFVTVCVLGFLIRIYERPYFSSVGRLDFNTLGSSIYMVMITVLTVGYGDMYPCTVIGRALMVFGIICGIFIVSLLVVLLQRNILLDENKKDALMTVTRRKAASSCIRTAM